MAKENVIGLAMNLDVTDLKSGIQEVNKSIKKSKEEFSNATAGMDKWNSSSAGLSAKLKQLSTQLDSQKKAVSGYQAEIERVKNLEGDHSAELENLNSKLAKAQAEVKKTESSINYYSKSLATVSKEEQKTNSELGKLTATISLQEKELKDLADEYKNAVLTYGKNSKEAKTLAKRIDTTSSSLDKNKSAVEKTEKAYSNLTKETKKASDTINELGDVADKGLSILSGLGKAISGALAGLGASFIASAEGTKEYRTALAKLDTSFEASGHEAKLAEQTYSELYSVLGDTDKSVEASMQLSKLAKDEKDLNNLTGILTGVYATFGDSLPVEGLAEAMNHTAKLGSVQGNLADALEWSGINVDDFNAQLENLGTESERSELIQGTLLKLYGETGKAYKENNKDLIANNEAQNSLNETMARVGELAQPIVTQFKQMGAEILERLLPVVEELTPKILEMAETIGSYIEPVLTFFIGTALPFLIDNLPTIIALVGTLTAGFGALKVAQLAMNLAMNANPIGLLITAIGLLVSAFVTLWTKSEAFRNFFITMWDNIKKALGVVILAIITGFYSAVDGIKDAWNGVTKFFSDLWQAIKDVFSTVGNWFSDIFTTAWDGIKTAWANVKKFFSDTIEIIKDTFVSLPDDMLDIGKNLVKGLWNGIKDMTKWITGKLKEFTGDILGGIKNFFGIHSPSDETAEIGNYLAEGLVEGIEGGESKVEKAGIKTGEAYAEGIKKGNELSPAIEKMYSNLEDRLGSESKVIGVIGNLLGVNLAEEISQGVEENVKPILQTTAKLGKEIGNEIITSTAKVLNENETEVKVKTNKKSVDKTKKEVKSISDLVRGVKSPDTWDVFAENCKKALGLSEKQLTNWKNKSGKIFSAVSDIGSKAMSKASEFASAISSYNKMIYDEEISKLDDTLEKFNESKSEELRIYTETNNKKLEDLKQQLDSGLITEEDYEKQREDLEKQLATYTAEIEKQKLEQEEETKRQKNILAKEQFESQKKTDIATAIIQGALAIVKGFAELGPIAGSINAVAQGTLTGIQLATIEKQKFTPFATGGVIDKPTKALIGEDGKEAIMPLERNTGWITELANQMTSIMKKDFLNFQMQPQFAGAGTVINNYYQTINSPKLPTRQEIYRDTKNLLSLKGR